MVVKSKMIHLKVGISSQRPLSQVFSVKELTSKLTAALYKEYT